MMRRPPIATRTYTRFPYPTRFRSLTILHGDDHRALGARLADRATLDVAREDDMRRLAHDLVLMDMAERPVVVLLGFEIIQAAGRVIGVALPACQRGVQHPDIEVMLRSGGIRSEEHTSELQSLMRISYAVFCFKKNMTQLSIVLYTIIV